MRQVLVMPEGEQAEGSIRFLGRRLWVAAGPGWAGWEVRACWPPLLPPPAQPARLGHTRGSAELARTSSVMTSGALDVRESSHVHAGTEREASSPFVRAVS